MRLFLAVVLLSGGIASAQNCRGSSSPSQIDVPPEGGSYPIVNTAIGSLSGCIWFPASSTAWIESRERGKITVEANPGSEPRIGSAQQAGTVSIRQAAGTSRCPAPRLSSYKFDAPAEGGNITVSFLTDPVCVWFLTPWQATSQTPYGNGFGNEYLLDRSSAGLVKILARIAPNPLPRPLSAGFVIGGQRFEVIQAAQVCDFTPSAGTLSLPANAGKARLEVFTFCTWDLREVWPWVHAKAQPAPFSDRKSVETESGENTDAVPRKIAITVVDKPLVIWQAPAGCTYQLIPSRLTIPNAGGEVEVYVNATPSCPWKLQLPWWLEPLRSAQGSGAKSVRLRASAAPSIGRAQPIVLAGVWADVSQQSSTCPVQIREISRKQEGFGSIELAIQTECAWEVRSDMERIQSVTPARGEGAQKVSVEFENTGTGADSSGWLAIGSELVRFTVPADQCSPRFLYPYGSAPGAGAQIEIYIAGLLPRACRFAPVANSPWLHVRETNALPGVAPRFTVDVDPNRTGELRAGVLTIAGQQMSIAQEPLRPEIYGTWQTLTLAPGLIFSLSGTDLSPLNTSGRGFEAAGTRLLVAGLPAYILSVSPTRIEAVVPFGIPVAGKVAVQAAAWGMETAPFEVNVSPTAPRAVGAIVNASTFRSTAFEPFGAGEVVAVFLTGTGQTTPASIDGEPYGTPAPVLTASVDASLSDWPIEVLYAGGAPGLIAGVSQINLLIPANFLPEPPAATPAAQFVNVWLTIRFDGKPVFYENVAIKTTAALPRPK